MAFRDSLLAARSRLQSVERELAATRQQASEVERLERENRALRVALARARSDYMPTAARLLGVGLAGASVLSVYLLAKLGLSLAGASLHVPNITVLAFGATLVGLFALSQLSFGTTAPASLLVGVFLFNQLAVLGTGVEMNAIAHVSWFAMIALATYIVARSYPTPSPTARLGATVLAATGFAQLVVAVCWDRLAILAASGHPGALHLMDFLGNGLLALYLAAALSLAACFFLARQQLLETAPVPPEVPEGHDVARCCCR